MQKFEINNLKGEQGRIQKLEEKLNKALAEKDFAEKKLLNLKYEVTQGMSKNEKFVFD